MYATNVINVIMAPRAIQKLNLLQWRWGKAILGCRYQRELKHHLVVAQCGWDLRLGTRLVLETLMYVARCSMAAEFGLGVSFRLQNYAQFPPEMLLAAKQNPSLRRYVLSTFRKQVSLPKLREFDRDQLQLACSDILIGLGFSPSQLQVSFFKLEWELSDLPCSSVTWRNFRIGAWSASLAAGHYPSLDILNYH